MAMIASLMQNALPHKFNAWKLAATGGRLEGELPFVQMPRLTSSLYNDEGAATFILQGGIDEQKVKFIAGRITARVTLVCQRCMTPVVVPLTVAVRLGLAATEARASELPESYEPLIVPAEDTILAELVEDELILALPIIPKCAESTPCGRTVSDEAPPAVDRQQPFAALAALLKDSKTEE